MFNTNPKISGPIDLRGVPLNGFVIDNISLKNLCFEYSDFSNSHIQQCRLYNINFANCDFKNSYISLVQIDKETHFSGCDFCNSYICIGSINSQKARKNIGEFKFNKISYFQLLRLTILKVLFNYKKNIKSNYTSFDFDDVLFYSSNSDTIAYLLWYKKVQQRILEKTNYNLISNFCFFLQVVLTKYWSSFISLLFFSIIGIFAFAVPYSNLIIEKGHKITYFDAVYFSVTCFTGLGSSSFSLNTNLLKSISLIESIIGYIVLALLIYLLSKKISDKY